MDAKINFTIPFKPLLDNYDANMPTCWQERLYEILCNSQHFEKTFDFYQVNDSTKREIIKFLKNLLLTTNDCKYTFEKNIKKSAWFNILNLVKIMKYIYSVASYFKSIYSEKKKPELAAFFQVCNGAFERIVKIYSVYIRLVYKIKEIILFPETNLNTTVNVCIDIIKSIDGFIKFALEIYKIIQFNYQSLISVFDKYAAVIKQFIENNWILKSYTSLNTKFIPPPSNSSLLIDTRPEDFFTNIPIKKILTKFLYIIQSFLKRFLVLKKEAIFDLENLKSLNLIDDYTYLVSRAYFERVKDIECFMRETFNNTHLQISRRCAITTFEDIEIPFLIIDCHNFMMKQQYLPKDLKLESDDRNVLNKVLRAYRMSMCSIFCYFLLFF